VDLEIVGSTMEIIRGLRTMGRLLVGGGMDKVPCVVQSLVLQQCHSTHCKILVLAKELFQLENIQYAPGSAGQGMLTGRNQVPFPRMYSILFGADPGGKDNGEARP